ncbi:MAG TPA: hypothetical protein VM618_07445 [Acidimicrobiia bacterium]|nr:hypothetical protein [Acidimicrobiia bacterium]
MAGSGRARRFRAARRLKEGPGERHCDFCHANLTLGEEHDADCDFAQEDPYAVDVPDPYAEYEQGSETEYE